MTKEKIEIKKSYLVIGIIVILILGIWLIPKLFGVTNKTNLISDHQVPEIGKLAPSITFTTIGGKELKLSDYKGQKVMLWYLATWCSSCSKGSQVLEQNNAKLNGMKIIALETFGDAGYKGIPIKQFAQTNAPTSLNYPNWIWGDASQQATEIYNYKNYPDIYYLINKKGIIESIDGAPSATINKIISFAQGR